MFSNLSTMYIVYSKSRVLCQLEEKKQAKDTK